MNTPKFYKILIYSILFIFIAKFCVSFRGNLYGTDLYYSIRNIFLNKNEICWNEINFKKVEKQLRFLEVKEKRLLMKGKSHIFLIIFENGLKAVFKGKNVISQMASLRAYHLSQSLDLRVVPPTVIRTIGGRRGVLQLFIEGQTLRKIDRVIQVDQVEEAQKTRAYLFYFLIGMNDPHTNNIIVGNNCGYLAVVDNDINMRRVAVNQYKDFPFVVTFSSKLEAFLASQEFPRFDYTKSKSIKLEKIDQDLFDQPKNSLPSKTILKWFKNKNDFVSRTLYYLDWYNLIWVKFSLTYYELIYIKFAPDVVSKKMIKSLKELGNLEEYNNSFFLFIVSYFDEQEIAKRWLRIKIINYFTLYNRKTLLEVFDR